MATVARQSRETFPAYHRAKAVNWSTLKEMAKSPLHYQYRLTHPPEETAAMRLGRAIHTAVLEPDVFPLEYVVFDGSRRAGAVWDEFALVNSGKTILKAEEYEAALDCRDAVRRHKVARRLLRWGKPEVTLKWIDPQTRIRCKGRLDWIAPGGVLVDLAYHEQLAFYRSGLLACGRKPAAVYIIAVEAEEPHDVAVFELDEDQLWAGAEVVGELLARVKECRRLRRWPGRDEGAQKLDLPPWIYDDAKDEEMALMGLVPRSK
jgi:hypothetical protein